MDPEGVPALLEALFIYKKTEILDAPTKAALRLCNKHFKNLVDDTVTAARVAVNALDDCLNDLVNTDWEGLKKLHICQIGGPGGPNPLHELPSALFVNFSLDRRSPTPQVVEFGKLTFTHSPAFLPGQLTTLEEFCFYDYRDLSPQGLAPLQYLPGLTSLSLAIFDDSATHRYPDFICNLTTLKHLLFNSNSVAWLPDALGNLTNLESLEITVSYLQELPESIGNLNALREFRIRYCFSLNALPESFDDLLWRKAHETGGLKMERVSFSHCPRLVLSAKIGEALELLHQNGVDVQWVLEDDDADSFISSDEDADDAVDDDFAADDD